MNNDNTFILKEIKIGKTSLKLLSMGIKPGNIIQVKRRNISRSTLYITMDQKAYGIDQSLFEQLELEPILSIKV